MHYFDYNMFPIIIPLLAILLYSENFLFKKYSILYCFASMPLFTNSFISGIQVGVEGRNLALLYSKVPHIDPEASLFGAGADGFGIERAGVPSTRGFGFNLRATF